MTDLNTLTNKLADALEAVEHLAEMHRRFRNDAVTAKTLEEFVDEKLRPLLAEFRVAKAKDMP